MNGPLHGIRVLDLSRILAGPFCTMLLADLGAEVVKVEQPGRGDPARHLDPLVGQESVYFISVNRGKKSITLDLSLEEGRRLLLALLPQFDVLVENFVPGAMQRLGLDYARIKEAHPRLIYCSISGFGQNGPYAQRPALDIIVQAMGGLMSVTGEPGGPPIRPGASLGDSVAGLFGALAVVAALFQRQQSGQGQHLDLAMLDCQVTMMENAFSRYFASGQAPGRLGSRHPAAAPFQAFHASDGDFVVALLTDDPPTWRRLAEAIGRPELGDDPRFQDNRGRLRHVDTLAATLQDTFQQRPVNHWLQVLQEAGAPCGPVNTIAQVVEDLQVRHRSMIATIPQADVGDWRVANTPFNFSHAGAGPAGPAPRLGEHTQQVLQRWLHLSQEEVTRLRAGGVV